MKWVKLRCLSNTKLWKHLSLLQIQHKMSQGMKTIIEVHEQRPLVAKNEKFEIKLSDQH